MHIGISCIVSLNQSAAKPFLFQDDAETTHVQFVDSRHAKDMSQWIVIARIDATKHG